MRLRFRIRWTMISVAVAAALLAGGRWVAAMRYKSRIYRNEATIFNVKSKLATIKSHASYVGADRREAAKADAVRYARLRDDYNVAAAHPWRDLPTAADRLRVARANEPEGVEPPPKEARHAKRHDLHKGAADHLWRDVAPEDDPNLY